ncbi:MAG: D-alanyl-D-alanine carboxypeptidase family protein [Rhizobiaceae bacterium]
MKNLLGILALAIAFTAFGNQANAGLRPLSSTPHIVVDVQSGKVFARNKAFVRWAPASLTKLMTAYAVFRALDLQHLALNSPVRISEQAIKQPPSKMGLPVGTIMTIETALKIIMVKSANDVAVALGESVGGSEEAFVAFMNAHAKRIGMIDSNFTNPHGLHHPDQFTTARDMAVLILALSREFPQFANFFDIPALRAGKRRLRNHNALLRLYDGTNGMKTGYVCASGYNVVVRTRRKGRELAAVVLGHRSGLSRSVEAAELLTAAFEADGDGFRPTVNTILKPDSVPSQPVDITRAICPRKYPARVTPYVRPLEAPSSQDFDGIDTQVLFQRAEAEKNPLRNLPIPTKRPFFKFASIDTTAGSARNDSETVKPAGGVKKNNGPSLRQRAKLFLKPRKNLRKDVRIAMGGGVGPNPFGIKHTNGSVYQSPIPVPQKRPVLDLEQTRE